MSQADLATRLQRLGMANAHQMLVSRVESGQRSVTVVEALSFAEALGVPLSVLSAEQPPSNELKHLDTLTRAMMDAMRDLTSGVWPEFEMARNAQIEYLQKVAGDLTTDDPADQQARFSAARAAYLASRMRHVYGDSGLSRPSYDATVRSLVAQAVENIYGKRPEAS